MIVFFINTKSLGFFFLILIAPFQFASICAKLDEYILFLLRLLENLRYSLDAVQRGTVNVHDLCCRQMIERFNIFSSRNLSFQLPYNCCLSVTLVDVFSPKHDVYL